MTPEMAAHLYVEHDWSWSAVTHHADWSLGTKKAWRNKVRSIVTDDYPLARPAPDWED